MKKLVLALALIMSQANIAPAATMTFDPFDFATADFNAKNYIEDGITVTGNGRLYESFGRGGGDAMYIADGGWGGPTFLSFTMSGIFDAISFDLTPSMFTYFVGTLDEVSRGRGTPSSFVNVRVQGFGTDGLTAVTSFNMGTVREATTYVLGAAFANLTNLVIGFEPTSGFGKVVELGPNRYGRCNDSPCSRYVIDNVTLAPVPLPAGLPLMLGALIGLSAMARRRKTPVSI